MKNKKILIGILLVLIFLISGLSIYLFKLINTEKLSVRYLRSKTNTVSVYDENLDVIDLIRGKEVKLSDKTKKINNEQYYKFYLDDNTYYLTDLNILVDDIDDVVLTQDMYVYRTCTTYLNGNDSKIKSLAYKGEEVKISGYYGLHDDGSVTRYLTDKGYILSKYLCANYEDAMKHSAYEIYHENIYTYDNGNGALGMDYFENEKPLFEDNVMPDEVKAIYINDKAIYELDDYIDLALDLGANALVIDIRDSHIVTVKLDCMKDYSISSYMAGMFDKEEFKQMMNKVKENGLYLIGRITAFKDNNFAIDHPEECIIDLEENAPLIYGEANWPTAYSRKMWEYNVEISKECIRDLGFNAIQFDYVRFPEQTDYYADKLQILDLQNKYDESRSEAIQRFLMYAADEIHSVHGYLSACVFGETSNSYIAAYGQYWPAISNVVDVISPMPYPDHFNMHEYGINDAIVWEVPYRLLSAWAKDARLRQEEIPSPAKVRSWLQGYNAIHEPKIIYDVDKVIEQIEALKDNDLYDGFMIWNVLSDYVKLQGYKEAFN